MNFDKVKEIVAKKPSFWIAVGVIILIAIVVEVAR